MSTSGKVAQDPAANPSGSSCGVHGAGPGSDGPGAAGQPPPTQGHTGSRHLGHRGELLDRVPLPRPGGMVTGPRLGPVIAEATADVVAAGADRVHSCTRRPCSARQTPAVSPITPAPTTTTSGLVTHSSTPSLTSHHVDDNACAHHYVVWRAATPTACRPAR